MDDVRTLLANLVAVDPICRNSEGLDNRCHWCDDRTVGDNLTYHHEPGCAWLTACHAIGAATERTEHRGRTKHIFAERSVTS